MRSPSPQPTAVHIVSRVRYKVLAFGVCLAAITYLDRVCISITAPEIMRELSLSPLQMSFVFSAFTMAYGLFEIPTGWWGDRVGTRRVMTRIVSWWSFFTIVTTFQNWRGSWTPSYASSSCASTGPVNTLALKCRFAAFVRM